MIFSVMLGTIFLVGVEGMEHNSSSLSLDTHFCIQEYFGYIIPSLYEGCGSLVNVNTEMKDFTTNFSYEPSIQQNTFSPNVMYSDMNDTSYVKNENNCFLNNYPLEKKAIFNKNNLFRNIQRKYHQPGRSSNRQAITG